MHCDDKQSIQRMLDGSPSTRCSQRIGGHYEINAVSISHSSAIISTRDNHSSSGMYGTGF